jgi:hypothetical protein
MSGLTNIGKTPDSAAPQAAGGREQDALYQSDKLVARVEGAEVDLDAKEIRIGEVYQSDHLMIPEECEYQKYRILIQRIADATKVDKLSPHKGRILRGVVADIVGYREQ